MAAMLFLDPVTRIEDPAFPEPKRGRTPLIRIDRAFRSHVEAEEHEDAPHVVPAMASVAAGTGAAIAILNRALVGGLD